ncbi:MAG TPA: NAD-dependent succinate-semialdehyde dehydrogenase [Rhizobiaceae bacterium]|nr:NAD-dependent succinate-semialdehyde dehydrogenase [Rhizobiaceae bacterium]
MTSYPRLALYIAGEWRRDGLDKQAVLNPATEAVLDELPLARPADLDDALAAAASALPAWRAMPAIERCRIILKAVELVRERAESIAQVISLEEGKPIGEARAEIARASDLMEFMAHEGTRAYGRVIPARQRGWRQTVLKEPLGVVAAFAAWNFPAITPARKIAGPLAAGCTCILKAAEEVPGTAVELVRAFHDAGVPPGVVNLVFGNPPEVSSHLIPSPIVRKVTFTGSTAVGRLIGEMAGRGIKPVTLELGGHAPTMVFSDVDVGETARLAVAAKFRNAGQICVSPTRFLIQETVYDEFVDHFVERAKAIRIGPGTDPSSGMGPLANSRRLDAMHAHISDALGRGATLRTGGKRIGNGGFFWEPTVLTDVPADAKVMNEEPFGPLAVIAPFSSEEDAIARANALPYGLASYLFTSDADRQTEISSRLAAGLVGINSFNVGEPETPWGGVKDSGYGREGGIEGLESYFAAKYVSQAPSPRAARA